MPLFVPKTLRSRKGKNGVVKIQRDTYSNTNGSWHSQARSVKTIDGKCLACGKTAEQTPEGWLVVHHIVPLTSGGVTQKRKLITLCELDHSKRHNHLKRA